MSSLPNGIEGSAYNEIPKNKMCPTPCYYLAQLITLSDELLVHWSEQMEQAEAENRCDDVNKIMDMILELRATRNDYIENYPGEEVTVQCIKDFQLWADKTREIMFPTIYQSMGDDLLRGLNGTSS